MILEDYKSVAHLITFLKRTIIIYNGRSYRRYRIHCQHFRTCSLHFLSSLSIPHHAHSLKGEERLNSIYASSLFCLFLVTSAPIHQGLSPDEDLTWALMTLLDFQERRPTPLIIDSKSFVELPATYESLVSNRSQLIPFVSLCWWRWTMQPFFRFKLEVSSGSNILFGQVVQFWIVIDFRLISFYFGVLFFGYFKSNLKKINDF